MKPAGYLLMLVGAVRLLLARSGAFCMVRRLAARGTICVLRGKEA